MVTVTRGDIGQEIAPVCTQKLSEGKREIGTMLGKGLPLTA
jgi:hypothetical protein